MDKQGVGDLCYYKNQHTLIKERHEAATEIENLRAAFARYGDHTLLCRRRQARDASPDAAAPFRDLWEQVECSCGFPEALQESER